MPTVATPYGLLKNQIAQQFRVVFLKISAITSIYKKNYEKLAEHLKQKKRTVDNAYRMRLYMEVCVPR